MDPVREAIEAAVVRFGDRGSGLFNSAGFGLELMRVSGLRPVGLDGHLVEAILRSRTDVEPMPGGAHWRYRRPLWRRILRWVVS